MKILVIQKKMMGDVLVSSILFECLNKKFPDAELHYLITKNNEQVVRHHKYIDKIIFFEDFFSTLKAVKSENYDIIIDCYAKVETAIISFLSGAKKRISFFKNYTKYFYTDTILRRDITQFSMLTTALEHRLRLLEPLGIKVEEIFPKIYLSQEELEGADALLNQLGVYNEDLIMISTFGSNPEKTYPLSYMAEIINIISENSKCRILCNFLPSQKEMFLELYELLSEKAKKQVVKSFDTQNLRQYIAVLSKCKLLIGNEGGSTNISKALRIPTFSIYAPFVSGWDWRVDGRENVSIHAKDYQIDDYKDFKPNLFKKELINFIKRNL